MYKFRIYRFHFCISLASQSIQWSHHKISLIFSNLIANFAELSVRMEVNPINLGDHHSVIWNIKLSGLNLFALQLHHLSLSFFPSCFFTPSIKSFFFNQIALDLHLAIGHGFETVSPTLVALRTGDGCDTGSYARCKLNIRWKTQEYWAIDHIFLSCDNASGIRNESS